MLVGDAPPSKVDWPSKSLLLSFSHGPLNTASTVVGSSRDTILDITRNLDPEAPGS